MPHIVLASASPRRKQLLSHIVDDFTQASADIDETPFFEESAFELVGRLATLKAKAVQRNFTDALVIGSDTVVAINNTILGKPKDYNEFKGMMRLLSEKTHEVFTAVSVLHKQQCLQKIVVTEVTMGNISVADAEQYWSTQEPQDKAGGYAIQGIGGQFVKSIVGSFSAVVGLPMFETKQLINQVVKGVL